MKKYNQPNTEVLQILGQITMDTVLNVSEPHVDTEKDGPITAPKVKTV